jgi:hypothetical protein
MPSYFAFGSNMSRRRLEERVGVVNLVGRASLPGYEHRFDKFGFDGTAKGNIAAQRGETVHGVLYRLTTRQLSVLTGYEGGYRGLDVEVSLLGGGVFVAHTFVALKPGCDVEPSEEYLVHYARGMAEHGLPRTYANRITAGLSRDLVQVFERAWEGVIAHGIESW